ncbi:MAG: dipeptide ABC transporter ATP-binding protein [Actinomycetota bacterium]
MTDTTVEPTPSTPAPLLEVDNLITRFPIRAGLFQRTIGHVHAVEDVSIHVAPKETVGIVGESGCGKTTFGRSLLRLVEPTSGSVRFDGRDVIAAGGKEMKRLRREMQIVFQDPYASLNPRMPVHDIISEPLRIHGTGKKEARQKASDFLAAVGLLPEHGNRYPHEFSGGQRQRIGIARAMALQPKLIILDEPVSALDVSIQAQVINLLEDLQEQFDLTYLFIAHDLSVVRHISDRVVVMYLGRLAEVADRNAVYDRPAHPYTASLLSAVPIPDPDLEGKRQRIMLQGDIPSPASPPSGCRFRTRCPIAVERCATEEPQLAEVEAGHQVACHFPLAAGETLVERVRSMGRTLDLLDGRSVAST